MLPDLASQALAAEAEDVSLDQRREVAEEFESVLLATLLKEMRSTLGEEGLFPGDTTDTYGGIFDLYLSQHLAHSGGLGIARLVMERYLNGVDTP